LTLLIGEWCIRRLVTHVVRQELSSQGGLLEANPEFLIEYDGVNRRFVPNAKVVIKNHYVSGKDISISINSLGLRDDEIPTLKSADELRILVLGDSITAADYLPAEETFVKVLEHKLTQALPTKAKVRVINAGIGNTGTEEALSLLREKVQIIAPDIVLLAFYLNDSRPPWGFSGEIGNHGWLRRNSVLVATAYRLLAEQNWISQQNVDRFAWIPAVESLNWKENESDFKKLTELAQYDWGAAWQDSAWMKTRQDFAKLKEASKSYDFQVWIAALPVTFQLQTSFATDYPQKKLSELSKEFGFGYVDTAEALKQANPSALYFDHCHPNAQGNEVIAEVLAKALTPALN
jgi:lysophospholipase L1-like esterase